MKIKFKPHARKRMGESRQNGITNKDVILAVSKLPGKAVSPHGFRIKNAKAKSGRKFDVVIVDENNIRNIITVVGLQR